MESCQTIAAVLRQWLPSATLNPGFTDRSSTHTTHTKEGCDLQISVQTKSHSCLTDRLWQTANMLGEQQVQHADLACGLSSLGLFGRNWKENCQLSN